MIKRLLLVATLCAPFFATSTESSTPCSPYYHCCPTCSKEVTIWNHEERENFNRVHSKCIDNLYKAQKDEQNSLKTISCIVIKTQTD